MHLLIVLAVLIDLTRAIVLMHALRMRVLMVTLLMLLLLLLVLAL